jgi:ubiquinone/menaquinone biosynthesis C-methylase UbiE
VGCGTGALLDMKITTPDLYTGIDPSQGMLNQLFRKHPEVTDLRPVRV